MALARGMDSGFMPNLNGTVSPPPQVAMMVKVETPLWFYCRQANHCGEGMTFSINPTANKTQAAFEALAIAQNGTGSAAGIVASAPAAPGVSASSSSNTGGAIVSGQGTLDTSGACVCAVQCGVGSFPDVAVQGVAAFGGMQGQVPAKAVEVTA